MSEVARVLGVDRKTLRRWVKKKQIPAPNLGIADGRPSKCWTEVDLTKIKQYKDAGYWGKGIDRKTGKKSKKKNE